MGLVLDHLHGVLLVCRSVSFLLDGQADVVEEDDRVDAAPSVASFLCWVGDKPWKYNSKPKSRPKPTEDETRSYSPSDVIKYKKMVEQWIPEAKFRCLSNVSVPGVECIPLLSGLEGWWPKMELWRPDLPKGRNVYFDLDTLIIRDPTRIVNYYAPFATIMPGPGVGSGDQDSPHTPEPWKSWQDQEGFWRVPKYQTSVIVWDSEYTTKIWKRWEEQDWKARLASDQDFLGEQFPYETRMPTEWFRKMPKSGHKPIPPRMVVLTMPMRNDQAASQYQWVRDLWN